MKRKGAILLLVIVVAFVCGFLLTAPAPRAPQVTVSFTGFSNALPFVGAPEEVRSLRAVFQVTNQTALRIAYRVQADAFQPGGNGSSTTYSGDELSGYGTGTFLLSTDAGSNGWTFHVITSISRPRPAWQHRVREIAKKFGARRVFIGPAKTYPQFTNTWTTPQS